MPSGLIHGEITAAATILTYAWGIKNGEAPALVAAAAVGCAAGLLLTPDLDIVGSRADGLIRRTGFIPAVIWGILWYPYSALLSHRSIWSHGLIIGTVIRVIYVAIPLLIIGVNLRPWPYLIRGIIGLTISDNLHIGADFLVSGLKTINRKRRK